MNEVMVKNAQAVLNNYRRICNEKTAYQKFLTENPECSIRDALELEIDRLEMQERNVVTFLAGLFENHEFELDVQHAPDELQD